MSVQDQVVKGRSAARARLYDADPAQMSVDRVRDHGVLDRGVLALTLISPSGIDVDSDDAGAEPGGGLTRVVLGDDGDEGLSRRNDPVGRVVEERVSPGNLRGSVARLGTKSQHALERLDELGDCLKCHRSSQASTGTVRPAHGGTSGLAVEAGRRPGRRFAGENSDTVSDRAASVRRAVEGRAAGAGPAKEGT